MAAYGHGDIVSGQELRAKRLEGVKYSLDVEKLACRRGLCVKLKSIIELR